MCLVIACHSFQFVFTQSLFAHCEQTLTGFDMFCSALMLNVLSSRWLNDKNSCPVCRKPLTGDQPEDPHLTRGSAPEAGNGLNRQRNWDNDMYASEVMFRMGRLQR